MPENILSRRDFLKASAAATLGITSHPVTAEPQKSQEYAIPSELPSYGIEIRSPYDKKDPRTMEIRHNPGVAALAFGKSTEGDLYVRPDQVFPVVKTMQESENEGTVSFWAGEWVAFPALDVVQLKNKGFGQDRNGYWVDNTDKHLLTAHEVSKIEAEYETPSRGNFIPTKMGVFSGISDGEEHIFDYSTDVHETLTVAPNGMDYSGSAAKHELSDKSQHEKARSHLLEIEFSSVQMSPVDTKDISHFALEAFQNASQNASRGYLTNSLTEWRVVDYGNKEPYWKRNGAAVQFTQVAEESS